MHLKCCPINSQQCSCLVSDVGNDDCARFDSKLVEVDKLVYSLKMEEDRHLFRQNLEGQLLKFTNVMKGFQYRWIVVESTNGVLEYYEREEHKKFQKPRSSVSLLFATVCPSDEDSQTFIVNTSQGENLRFKAADARERQLWVNHIRAVAEFHTEKATDQNSLPGLPSAVQRPSLLPVKEARPVMLNSSNSDQSSRSHRSSSSRTGRSADRKFALDTPSPYSAEVNLAASDAPALVDPYQQLNELFRLLEREGNLLARDIDDVYNQPTAAFANRNPEVTELYRNLLIIKATSQASIKSLKQCLGGLQHDNSNVSLDSKGDWSQVPANGKRNKYDEKLKVGFQSREQLQVMILLPQQGEQIRSVGSPMPPPITGMSESAFLVNRDEEVATNSIEDEEIGSVENYKSVIMHVVSQLKEGKDLTQIVLPTFILERRSLLEMFADYNAHPQLLINITNGVSPHERMKNFIKWYLTAFHASRKDKVARKPYNPIIGEIFQCSWRLPTAERGSPEQILITFCGEQVSHHPPISAFQINCPQRKIELVGAVHTQSQFRALSIYVDMIGKAMVLSKDLGHQHEELVQYLSAKFGEICAPGGGTELVILKLGEHNEEYIFSLPTAYGRSILKVPWFELGGTIPVECPQSGYSARIRFYTKARCFYVRRQVDAIEELGYGGSKNMHTIPELFQSQSINTNRLHRVLAELFAPTTSDSSEKPVVTVTGHWNSTMEFVDQVSGTTEVIDARVMKREPKWVRPVSFQAPEESQRLWTAVTAALEVGDIDLATKEKTKLEEIQRASEQARTRRHIAHTPRYFKETPNGYVPIHPLATSISHSD
ncbi:Oxysterol-binding protein-related protein [Echinococcus granulosus]|uniref:Oxysterol-binding protein n=1 Tax=Echinococcus granulosus TaxID=6210 RepID=W6UVF7_ECHGR|nr:Oxysterol-binding protein-related protein [Echinococcus granulosus]EUB64621.1 Oxysterol-binding protein-related protein [Echinococcus granulosus]